MPIIKNIDTQIILNPNTQDETQTNRQSKNFTIPTDHNQGDKDDLNSPTIATNYSYSAINSKIKVKMFWMTPPL